MTWLTFHKIRSIADSLLFPIKDLVNKIAGEPLQLRSRMQVVRKVKMTRLTSWDTFHHDFDNGSITFRGKQMVGGHSVLQTHFLVLVSDGQNVTTYELAAIDKSVITPLCGNDPYICIHLHNC